MSSELESERDRRLRKALRTAATILYGIVLVGFLVFLLTGGSLSGHRWILVILVASGIAVFAGDPDRIRSDSVRAMIVFAAGLIIFGVFFRQLLFPAILVLLE